MIFVTGGTGLTGSYLLLSLCEKEGSIRALKLKNTSTSAVKQLFERENASPLFEKIQWVDGNLDDVCFLEDCLRGVSRVFHAAAYISFDEREKREIFNTNVKGTENLVNACISLKVKEFVYFSSIGTLDGSGASDCIDESGDWNNELSHCSYELSKFKAEMSVWRASQEGLDVLVLCPSVIIGSLDGERENEAFFKRAWLKTTYTTTGEIGFVDVRDVVTSTLMLVEKRAFNKKYILSSENKPYREVQGFLCKKNNKKEPKLISDKVLFFIYFISKLSAFFGGRYLSKANYQSLKRRRLYSNEKLLKELNFSFIPVESALEYHFERYNQQRDQDNSKNCD